MDPNETLRDMVQAADAVLNDEDVFYPDNLGQDAVRLAEGFKALHEWLMAGGFFPAAWNDARIRHVDTGNYLPGRSAAEHGGE